VSTDPGATSGVRPPPARDRPGRLHGLVGGCYDNAVTESFFATLECELLDRARFATRTQARTAVFDYLEGFYNPPRRHSTLGYLSPAEYERRHHTGYPAA
jgi:transposase InsO family protein